MLVIFLVSNSTYNNAPVFSPNLNYVINYVYKLLGLLHAQNKKTIYNIAKTVISLLKSLV